jgi:hypothetical protein
MACIYEATKEMEPVEISADFLGISGGFLGISANFLG